MDRFAMSAFNCNRVGPVLLIRVCEDDSIPEDRKSYFRTNIRVDSWRGWMEVDLFVFNVILNVLNHYLLPNTHLFL